ncbi:MAG: hybrid sensor histidine kinase/response regulator [Cyanobacteria bacterium P01_G01_bin.49]
MNKEQQVRINFLDEAENCFDQIESVLLGLATTAADPQQLDLALRSAHSVKGGAGMMGFAALAHVAHRLEDFFKILRVRHHSTQISTEVETLLLQGVDSLRQVSVFHRQDAVIDDSWLSNHVQPIFDQLHQHLGDLRDEDEDALFSQNQGTAPELLMFEDGVEPILEQFEEQLEQLPVTGLSDTLILTAEQLMILSQMANLEPFTQLCESIQEQATLVSLEQIQSLATEALTIWKRSHALVARGRLDKLPSELTMVEETNHFPLGNDIESLDLDLAAVQAELANFDEQSLEQFESEFASLSDISFDTPELAELQAAFSTEEEIATPEPQPIAATPKLPQTSQQSSRTVRVSVEQLYQFNNLFGKLILERNAVNLRLEQLRNFSHLMRQRMNQLEQSNTQLRKWYDRASLEGIVPVSEQTMPTTTTVPSPNQPTNDQKEGQFDALEMDRYSDLHLISQEQIETIVQLQEVTTDIDLGLQDMNQAMRDLNQTTRSLQENVTRTQMLPFADVVTPFPRMLRDLSVQLGKQVNLKIEGKATLIDRALIETLNAPLTHLLRNAFAHGIEDPATRLAAGKPSQGTITLQAVNRGTQTVITVRDDGDGISLDKIRDRLREMGISEQEIQQMSKREILNYIFEPGFSTADQVTELSGRGVGMDVVRTNLQDIRGDIQVQTQVGQGTTFILTVPFSLSILRVTLVERSGMILAIPADSIKEMLCFSSEEISAIEDLNELTWNQQTIPVVRLEESLQFRRPRKPFEMPGNPLINKLTALVVGEGTTVGGIYLDRVWGEQEVSIRPIDSPLPLPPGFISSMVSGDGRVIPLVDPVQLLQGCLEAHHTENEIAVNAADQTPNISASQEQPNTILVVDDSINVRRYLALTLEKAGYQVEQAKDGQEAVDKLFGGMHIQAVICDIEMPRLDGYSVLEEVKGNPAFQSLPIAMLTSRSNEKHRKLAMNLGASAYFSKPCNEQELLQTLRVLISSSRSVEV